MNLSGDQWFALLVIGVPALIVISVVAGRRAAERRRAAVAAMDGRQVPATPDAVRQAVQLRLADVRNLTVTQSGSDTLTVQRRYFPAWTIVVAVAFFPLGLLALLARRTDSATVLLSPTGTGSATKVRVAGTMNRRTVEALDGALR